MPHEGQRRKRHSSSRRVSWSSEAEEKFSTMLRVAARRFLAAMVAVSIWLRSLWGSIAAWTGRASARAAAAAPPGLRPLLCRLAPAATARSAAGTQPQQPHVVAVVITDHADNAAAADEQAAAMSGGSSDIAALQLDLAALCRLIGWASRQRLSHLVLYEPSGLLQHAESRLELLLMQQQLLAGVRLVSGLRPLQGAPMSDAQQQERMTVLLLSAADGQWPLLASVAASNGAQQQQHVRRQPMANGSAASATASNGGAREEEASRAAVLADAAAAPAKLRARVQAAAGPEAGLEPDLVLVTGGALTLAGYPPWAVRVSEIYGIGPLAGVTSSKLAAVLARYARTRQRFGR